MEPASLLAHRLRKLAAQSDNGESVSEAIRALLQLDRDSKHVDIDSENVEQRQTRAIGRMRSL